jgi:hypothetical protein
MQFSTAVRNARADAMETTIGTSPQLRIRSGAAPANPAATRTGTVLATLPLPSDWLVAASAGVKALLGTWADSAADASGTAGHWEIMDTALTNCHVQGSVGTSGAELNLLSLSLVAGQPVNITSFNFTEGNA